MLSDPQFLDANRYPTIEIKLERFNPQEKPRLIEGLLSFHGVKKRIQVQVELFDISPLVVAKGWFSIKQTDFNIRRYRSGLLEVADSLEISFQLFFCERRGKIPEEDNLDSPELQRVLLEEGITILREPTFWGCQELKGSP